MSFPRLFLAIVAFLLAGSAARSDEGFYLFSRPPRAQLKERYAFELTDAWLDKLRQAAVDVGDGGSGSFVSRTGLVLTNRHVALRWLQELSETTNDKIMRDGYYAASHDKELPCVGLELRVMVREEDVTARVAAAIKPGMPSAQAVRAREAVLLAIEAESTRRTGLTCEVVPLDQGGRYQLCCYRQYTDVRLVFAPDAELANPVDCCFLRAYENGKPAQTPHFLPWSPDAPAVGDLTLLPGCPGPTDRFCTVAHLEHRHGPLGFLQYKASCRLKSALTELGKLRPDLERHTSFEIFALENQAGHAQRTLSMQEELLEDIRAREKADQAQLQKQDPAAARQWQAALDQIAAGTRECVDLALSESFLEAAAAFQTPLFDYARHLLRLADEAAKPEQDRLPEYRGHDRDDCVRWLVQPHTVIKEMERVKLAESLDLWAHYAGPDRALVKQVLQGRTPRDCARDLIAGTHLDRLEVRQALLNGGRKAVAQSSDTMLVLARLVDARSRQVRKDRAEKLIEPRCQAYAVLSRLREQAAGPQWYPDATGTLRLSFGRVLPFAESADVFRLSDALAGRTVDGMPPTWQSLRGKVDAEAILLFRSSADAVPGNSGSPVVDRQGRLVGIATWVNRAAPQLAYGKDDWGLGVVAADGILALLEHAFHATELVKELGGRQASVRKAPPLPEPANVSKSGGPSTPRPNNNVVGSEPPLPPSDVYRQATSSAPPEPPPPTLAERGRGIDFSISPLPTVDTLLKAERKAATELDRRNQALIPALVKAVHDHDGEVRRLAERALQRLGSDATPFLIQALRASGPGEHAAAEKRQSANDAPPDLAALLRQFDDADVEVRRRAGRALLNMLSAPPPVDVVPTRKFD